MPLQKRKRTTSSSADASVNKPATRAQTDIQQFARVTKAAAAPSESRKRKAESQDEDQDVESAKPTPRKKLQRRPTHRSARPQPTPTDTPTRGASRLLADLDLSTPVRPLKLDPVAETPESAEDTAARDTSPSSAPSAHEEKPASDLPQGVQDLITLHSSFLTALSLHYAHNGIASPVDIRVLAPSVTKIWGKRKVAVEDIRRTIAVMQISLSSSRPASALSARTLHLSDYGHGKICIEQHEGKKQRSKRTNSAIPQHVDEKALNALFVSELTTRWSEYRAKITPNSKSPASVAYFVNQLPLADVTECASLAKVAPLLAKGQRRLEDLKKAPASSNCFNPAPSSPAAASASDKENDENARPASLKSASTKSSVPSHKKTASTASTDTVKTASSTATTATANSTTPLTTNSSGATSRATSLLDRILAKQAASAAAPAGATPEARARQAALHRCEDVLATLGLLATTASATSSTTMRVSFPLPRLVRDVQGSSRSPISAQEVRKVVEVLAYEITPGYVGFVKMGALEAVVVDRARKVADAEVRRRLVEAGMEQ